MPNTRYLSGRRTEQMLKRTLEAQGCHVTRSAGSKGKFDLIAVPPDGDKIRLIQVKSLKSRSNNAIVPIVRAWVKGKMVMGEHYIQQLYIRQSGLWILYEDHGRR